MSSPDQAQCDDIFERRSVKRAVIGRGALLFFMGSVGVHTCCIHDVTNNGAGIRLDRLNIVPIDFGFSFDNFRTMRRCRLIWRDANFIGAAFESCQPFQFGALVQRRPGDAV